MHPAGSEQRELAALAVRRPQRPDDARVRGRETVELGRQARRDDMADQQERHPEAKRDAQCLHRRHAQRVPLVDGDERERDWIAAAP